MGFKQSSQHLLAKAKQILGKYWKQIKAVLWDGRSIVYARMLTDKQFQFTGLLEIEL